MDKNKRGSVNNQLTCDVCKIDFVTNADYALHEFSKKHCDNLIKLAKHKPIVSKQKNKSEPQVEKEVPKINTVTHTGSFAKYGYFVPGEIYRTAEVSREFNTEYDPYLQKFAENPYKEEISHPIVSDTQRVPTAHCPNVSFSKKKKKKVKTCQICNVTLGTVPEYEAHMKSPQHIWKLKITGMGVSAHFVKASTDLHTTEVGEDSKPDIQFEENPSVNSANNSSGPFPLLYCSDCELLLNSPQQYNAHISGKSHLECSQRKAELKAKKEKQQNPTHDKLYCYSCKISLNNLFQYNEHKNGKKHKTKCRQLIKRGITIPPEERVPELAIPKINPNKPIIYPELYEKFVLEKQKEVETESKNSEISLQGHKTSGMECHQKSPGVNNTNNCDTCNLNFTTIEEFNYHNETTNHNLLSTQKNNLEIKENTFPAANTDIPSNDIITEGNVYLNLMETVDGMPCNSSSSTTEKLSGDNKNVKMRNDVKSNVNQIVIVTDNKPVKCEICNSQFTWQSLFDKHLNTEDHFKKIVELKLNGKSESEILNIIFSDRNLIKPDNSGRFTCNVCNVTTVSREEFECHINSIVHKYTQKDYMKKRTVEVKQIIPKNEQDLYFCKLCEEGWTSIIDFIQHLHSLKHKSFQRAEKAKKTSRKTFLQKQRLLRSLKSKNVSSKRLKTEKNPGVRTKIGGVATDLCTGAQAPIPNLESLEPKIDPVRNIHLGVCDPNTKSADSTSNTSKINFQSNQRELADQQSRPPPLIPPHSDNIPPLMPLPFFQPRPQYSKPQYFTPNRSWHHRSSPYPPPFGPFGARPPIMAPGPRPAWFPRPRWPKYSSGYR